VARNDRSRDWKGHRFTDLPRLRADLPLQFDEATNRTIELIDVLWLKGNAVVAAFEIESTTSIYSGLLRMSDLIAMQPNLNIPLYLVAPDERRQKVFTEVNRPTFSRLSPPLVELCRFIAFSALRDQLGQVRSFVRYLIGRVWVGVTRSPGSWLLGRRQGTAPLLCRQTARFSPAALALRGPKDRRQGPAPSRAEQ
jgi:hypothetical protein